MQQQIGVQPKPTESRKQCARNRTSFPIISDYSDILEELTIPRRRLQSTTLLIERNRGLKWVLNTNNISFTFNLFAENCSRDFVVA